MQMLSQKPSCKQETSKTDWQGYADISTGGLDAKDVRKNGY
jgi:hypothetical protein